MFLLPPSPLAELMYSHQFVYSSGG